MSTAVRQAPQQMFTAITSKMRESVRCRFNFKNCKGGFRIECCCEDQSECADFQSLCQSICNGSCSFCCSLDGKQTCTLSLCCGQCECQNTKEGCCITCTSSDAKCCEVLQACCDSLECCCK